MDTIKNEPEIATTQDIGSSVIDYWDKVFRETLEFRHQDTTHFLNLVRSRNYLAGEGARAMDLGCGGGSRTIQIAKEFPKAEVIGVDYIEPMAKLGNELAQQAQAPNCRFEAANALAMPEKYKGNLDLLFNFNFFCTFSEPEQVIKSMVSMEPEVMVSKGLFTQTNCDFMIHPVRHDLKEKPKKDGDLNIFGFRRIEKAFTDLGWEKPEFIPIRPLEPIARPEDPGKKICYTERVGEDLAYFTGPIYLPWYFCVAKRP